MIEWIRNLELEFVILFAVTGILLFLALVILIKSQRILNLIGKRALVLTEDLLKRDGVDVVDIMVANTSYVNVEAAAIGLIYQKTLRPLKEESTIILARDSYKLTHTLEDFRNFVLGSDDKIKRVYIYVEDSLGRRSLRKAKNSVRKLKQILKKEHQVARKEEKRIRFETGSYNFIERVGLVFAVIFSPLTKLFRTIRKGLNRSLKKREFKNELKRKEMEHQEMLREVAEEEKRESDRSNLEKKLQEEKIKANLEARQKALDRKEEAKRMKEELKRSEEELKIAEVEAQLHEEKENDHNDDKEDDLKDENQVEEPVEKEEKTDVKEDIKKDHLKKKQSNSKKDEEKK
ncbi:MAG: hypothetical protein WC992_07835 [Acholeplasmataceae bacterium]